MRLSVIPAQITTVEDKIAGNLNLTQILILMFPVLFTTLVYTLIYPGMQFTWYKLPPIFLVLLLCFVLSLRVRGKVIFNWLIVILKFNLRPKFYVFNKNDVYLRTIVLPNLDNIANIISQVKNAKRVSSAKSHPGNDDYLKLAGLMENQNLSFQFKTKRNGGLHVAFE